MEEGVHAPCEEAHALRRCIDLPKVNTPKVNTPNYNTLKVETPKVNTPVEDAALREGVGVGGRV